MTWVYLLIAVSVGYLIWATIRSNLNQQNTPKSRLTEWGEGLTLLSECRGETVQFTYQKNNAPNERRTIKLVAILQDSNGTIYLHGLCQLRKEKRSFNIDKITTMLKINSKRIDAGRYIEETYNVY